MRKLIWAINVTIDGFADHTAVVADDELHDYYTGLLDNIDIMLFGRKTYQLMESYWPNAAEDPEATKSMIRFAGKINRISKIVFSKTLDKVSWYNTKLVKEDITEEVLKLKQQPGKHLSLSGISVATAFMNLGLIDEYWFVVQPILLGTGRHLVEDLKSRQNLKLMDVKVFNSGVVVHHYRKI